MKIKGVFNKERFIALSVDTAIAIALSFFFMIVMRDWRLEIKLPMMILAYIGYFILFEGLFSRTPGKYFQGLIVRKLDGSKIGWKEALLRGVMIVFELNPFAFGGLPAGIAVLSSEQKQRLGDMLAGTVVVSDKLDFSAAETPEEIPALHRPPPPEPRSNFSDLCAQLPGKGHVQFQKGQCSMFNLFNLKSVDILIFLIKLKNSMV